MTEWVRPRVASSRATRAPREYPATRNWPTPSRSSCRSTASARGAASSARGGIGEGRAYLEKIIQVAYRVPPADEAKIRQLIVGYGKRSGISDAPDEIVVSILVERAGRNPRKIKRVMNSFVLEYQVNPAWRNPPLDSSLLVTAVLMQHLYNPFTISWLVMTQVMTLSESFSTMRPCVPKHHPRRRQIMHGGRLFAERFKNSRCRHRTVRQVMAKS